MKVILQRLVSSNEGTFGVIEFQGKSLFTGELPWRENAANLSCIPQGLYHCVWSHSARFKRNLYLLSPTDPRTGVRIHPANLVGDISLGLRSQLNGCIALGEKLGWMHGQRAVLLSQPAVRKFEDAMGKEPFDLEIRDVTATRKMNG